jgi:hypothetical protein
VFSPGTALEGSRVLLRASAGLVGTRSVHAHLAIVRPGERSPRLLEREVTLSASTPMAVFRVRGGELVEDTAPLPQEERPLFAALELF